MSRKWRHSIELGRDHWFPVISNQIFLAVWYKNPNNDTGKEPESFFFTVTQVVEWKEARCQKGIFGVMSKKAGVERGGKVIRRSTIYFRPYNKSREVNTCVLFWVGENHKSFGCQTSLSFPSDCPHILVSMWTTEKLVLFSYTRKEEQLQRWLHLLETWRRAKLSCFMGDILRVTSNARDMTGFKWAQDYKKKNRCRVDENHKRGMPKVCVNKSVGD